MDDKTTCTVTQNGVTVTISSGFATAEQVYEVLRLAFLGAGYHPDNVKELMGGD